MRMMLGYGLIFLAIVVAGALAWLYTPDKQGAALEAMYALPPSVFLELAGVRLHVRDTGPRTNTVHFAIRMAALKSMRAVGCGMRGRSG